MQPTATYDFRSLYAQAADLIDECGWQQRTDGNREIGFCAGGAIYEASGQRHEVTFAACRRLAVFLGASLVGWNDQPERTKEQVVAFLRECAAAADVEASA